MRWTTIDTPIGWVGIAVVGRAVCRVALGAEPGAGIDAATVNPAPSIDAQRELRAYFAGELTAFSVPVRVTGGSGFERAVWDAIAAIPYGQTRSYGEIARSVGQPDAAQAVGTACNRNPVPIIVPCHRVIGADGKLVGFGGGLHRKRWLLQLEARVQIEHSFAGRPL